MSILPKYDVVIFDEAHTMEAVAGDHLGLSITNGQVEYTLRKLYNDRTNRGLLVHHKLRDAQKEVWECRDRADGFFESVAAWLAEQPKGNGRVRQPGIVANPLGEGLKKLVATLRHHGKQIERPEQRQDFTAAANRLEAIAQGIDDWLGQQMADSVYWIDRGFSRSRLRITLAAAPIDVGPVLREHLFTQVPTAIMTSATLATGGRGKPSFEFFQSRIGLADVVRTSVADRRRMCRYRRRRSGWAARSTIADRRRSCCWTACPTRAATARGTSGRPST